MSNNDGRVEAYRYHERMSDDGGEDEADHEERRKHCGLILLWFVQEFGGNRRDGDVDWMKNILGFVIMMCVDGAPIGIEA